MLRNKKVIRVLIWQGVVLWMLCSYIMIIFVKNGTRADYNSNDFFLNLFRNSILNIPNSKQIVYLTINDKTYRDFFQENQFNRELFADGLRKLKDYNPESIIMDLIFAYPSNYHSDSCLVARLKEFNKVFLPVSFSLENDSLAASEINKQNADSKLKEFLDLPILLNKGKPYYAGRGILTGDQFLKTAAGIGHISDLPDNDGIYRHSNLLIKVDTLFLPSLFLITYLDYIGVPFKNLKVEWDNKIIIPALSDSWINHDIEIPIDEHGNTIIPFVDNWSKDFENISLGTFYKLSNNSNEQGKLLDFFEGKFVIIGDISTGIADLGSTSLHETEPLISVQANMLNALLTDTFINKWNNYQVVLFLFFLIGILTFSAIFTKIRIFYFTSLVLTLILVITVIFQIKNHSVFPHVSVLALSLFSFIVLLIQVQYFTQKEKKYAEIENLKKEHEMSEAKKIQLSMLPSTLPKIDSLEIETYMSTAAIVGGDYYDFFLDGNNTLNFVIADATGHGLKAGTMVTVVKTLFINIREDFNLENILNDLSKIIKKLKLPQLYVCLSLFKYKDYNLKFTCAGMPPILIYRSNTEKVDSIILKGMPLGHVDNFPYEIRSIDLNPGDTLLITSDGLTELFNEKKEMLGTENLSALLQKIGKHNPKEIIQLIGDYCKKWANNIAPEDDVTILVIKVK